MAFKSHELKQEIMTKIGNAHDLQPSEREENKRLIEKAQEDHAAEEEDSQENAKFIVVGHGEQWRAIKIKKKN